MSTTSDPLHPGLHKDHRGPDIVPVKQNEAYLVLSEDELSKGYVRPYRDAYLHVTCRSVTTMGHSIAATYARDPYFYGATYCCACQMHRPLTEFVWDGTNIQVGT